MFFGARTQVAAADAGRPPNFGPLIAMVAKKIQSERVGTILLFRLSLSDAGVALASRLNAASKLVGLYRDWVGLIDPERDQMPGSSAVKIGW